MRRLLIALTLTAVNTFAATFLVPTDDAFVRASKAIVVGTAGDSHGRWAPGGWIETVTEFQIEEAIRGRLHEGDVIDVTELGGQVGEIAYTVAGSPRYAPGERVLLFLEQNGRGEWVAKNMALGKFAFARDTRGRRLLLRDAGSIGGWDETTGDAHREQARDEERFLQFVRATARGRNAQADYFVENPSRVVAESIIPNAGAAASTYLLHSGALGFRWSRFPSAVTFLSHGTQTGALNGGLTSVTRGIGSWTNDPGSNIVYQYGGTTSIAVTGLIRGCCSDGVNTIQLNDPSDEIPGSFATGGATLAVGGVWSSGSTHNAFGETFLTIVEADLVVQDGITGPGLTGNGFDHVITHELGHTLGIRHSDEPPAGGTSTSNAIMNSGVAFNSDTFGSALQAWDIEAISAVYGAGPSAPPCNPVQITLQPQSQSLVASPVTLTVAAVGDPPIRYQWYFGTRGNVSQPISGATGSAISVQPIVTTNYWVRVSNDCGSAADSLTATVTVNNCPAVNITGQSSSTIIIEGRTTTLSVSASGGSGLTYQWFIGSPGITTTSAGSGDSITVSPATTTTYWARATNSCGGFADSEAILVSVQPCTAPSILAQPVGGEVLSGSSTVLFVADAGTKPISYQWYEGLPLDTSNPVTNANAASFTTPLLIESKSYWVRITNDCGTINSAAAALNIVSACRAAVIAEQPRDQSVASGSGALLRIAATGTSLVYQWYQGQVLDFTKPVGGSSPTLVTPPITAATSFWVRVTAPCGSANSVGVTVSPLTRRRPSRG